MKGFSTFIKDALKGLSLLQKSDAEHYTYDIHGNVKTLLQDNPNLASINQQYKRIDYEYDLVSGNVNQVKYQDGQADAFYHKYEYDADNRITNVYTSKDNVIWDQDQKLFYYNHGSLARVELGDNKVQGLDYAYTLQGWIKGVNSNNLNSNNDIGQDGEANTNNVNRNLTRDAFGYSVNYYNGDYQAIDATKNQTANNFIASVTAAAYLQTDAPGLYNGNITSMVTAIKDIDPTNTVADGTPIPQLTAYRYDQLNRVTQMKAYRDMNLSANAWGDGSTYDASYETQLTYDANGNILTMQRNGVAGVNVNMDNLNYTYETVANGFTRNTNKLRHVNDAVANGNYATDIDDQGTFNMATFTNYAFDEIGNQIQDKSEDIAHQEWNVSGKVKSITRYNGSLKPDLEFLYDASARRIAKIVKPRDASGQRPISEWITTYYVHDAQGNVMGVYEQSNNPSTSTASFKLKERYMYGQSRLGADKTEVEMIGTPSQGNIFTRTLGNKNFELANFRGDILSVVTDRKIPVEDPLNLGNVAYWKPEIITTNETYLFGMPMPSRNVGITNSRNGYQGQESVDEINGKPKTIYTAEYWQYNTLTARRENNEPVVNPSESPYATFNNNPILISDPNGAEPKGSPASEGDGEKKSSESGESGETSKIAAKIPKTEDVAKKPEEKKDVKDLSFSQKGQDMLKAGEGFKSKLYTDKTGNATIGYGHLVHYGAVNGKDPSETDEFKTGITKDRAVELFKADFKEKGEDLVKAAVTTKLTQTQYDALVVFTFNVGHIKKTTLLQKVNEGGANAETIKSAFLLFNKGTVDGKPLQVIPGLTNRRTSEANLYNNGIYSP